MNQEQAFLQAIIESPAEDAPRLIFADWLEERGDMPSRERAEFIRVQFALRDLPPEHPFRPQLEERQFQLLSANATDWLEPLRTRCRIQGCAFRRGFVEKIALDVGQLAGQVETLFHLAPIQEVEFTSYYERPDPDSIQQLIRFPLLRQLTALDLSKSFSMTAEKAVELLSSPRLCGLQHLAVNTGQWRSAVLFLRASCLPNLTSLSLSNLTPEGSTLEDLFAPIAL